MKQQSSLCDHCGKTACARSTCHGLDFEPIENSKGAQLRNPLEAGVYIPYASERAFKVLYGASAFLTPVTAQMAVSGAVHVLVAIVSYKGNRPRKVFNSWGLYLVDFGKVTDSSCEVAIIRCFYFFGSFGSNKKDALTGPHRFALPSKTIFLADIKTIATA